MSDNVSLEVSNKSAKTDEHSDVADEHDAPIESVKAGEQDASVSAENESIEKSNGIQGSQVGNEKVGLRVIEAAKIKPNGAVATLKKTDGAEELATEGSNGLNIEPKEDEVDVKTDTENGKSENDQEHDAAAVGSPSSDKLDSSSDPKSVESKEIDDCGSEEETTEETEDSIVIPAKRSRGRPRGGSKKRSLPRDEKRRRSRRSVGRPKKAEATLSQEEDSDERDLYSDL